MQFIEQFGNLPVHAEFNLASEKYIKVSSTHGMDSHGKRREFSPKAVVEVTAPDDLPKVDLAETVESLEAVRRELAKAA